MDITDENKGIPVIKDGENVDNLLAEAGADESMANFSAKDEKAIFLGGINKDAKETPAQPFPESTPITKEEFDAFPKRTGFTFEFGKGNDSRSGGFNIDGDRILISAEFPFDIRPRLTPDHTKYFSLRKHGRKLVYPPHNNDNETSQQNTAQKEPLKNDSEDDYYIDKLTPRWLNTDKEKIEKLNSDQIAEMLLNLQGDELVFYSGAGISMGGELPAWGMPQLKKELGVTNPDDHFFDVFKDPINNPPAEIIQKLEEFKKQCFADLSTPAHNALTEIVKSKPGSIVFTENVDLKHEAEGSRLKAVHFDTGGDSFNKVRMRTPGAKVLVTLGLSQDDRGVIRYMKEHNPNLKIIAFNLSEGTIPKYLDDKDAVCLGDIQKILPEVAQKLQQDNK